MAACKNGDRKMMKKIIVIGSPGAGKSYFSKKLALRELSLVLEKDR